MTIKLKLRGKQHAELQEEIMIIDCPYGTYELQAFFHKARAVEEFSVRTTAT
jgi:hypothetical protein